jgi:hypothetical protein
MTAQSREIWAKQDLINVAKRHKDLFWLIVMNFLVAFICLGPLLTVGARGLETRWKATAKGLPAVETNVQPASVSQPPAQTNTAPVAVSKPLLQTNAPPATASRQSAKTPKGKISKPVPQTNAPPASASQPSPQTNTPPAVASQPAADTKTSSTAETASPPGLWDRLCRWMAGIGAVIIGPVTATLSSIPWGGVIPGSIIFSSLLTIFSNLRLATLVRQRALWYYVNPLLMLTAAVLLARYSGPLLRAFDAKEPWAYIALVLLSLFSLGALLPLVRLDSAATSLLDRHGIAFGALGAKMDHFEPHDIRRYRCPKCQIELLPEQEFWDGTHPKCIHCGTVGEPLPLKHSTSSAQPSTSEA